MLIAKGYDVGFRMEEGRDVVPPRRYAMLHDPSGRDWPACSVLIAPFLRLAHKVPKTKDLSEAEEYFGYVPREGVVKLPSRDMKKWGKLGAVSEIDYWRPGDEYKGDWWHPFGEAGWIFKSHLPNLYVLRSSQTLRLELGEGCSLNWRGFIWP